MRYILFMLSTYAVFAAWLYAIIVMNTFGMLLAFSLLTLNLSQLENSKHKKRARKNKDSDDMWYPGDDYGM